MGCENTQNGDSCSGLRVPILGTTDIVPSLSDQDHCLLVLEEVLFPDERLCHKVDPLPQKDWGTGTSEGQSGFRPYFPIFANNSTIGSLCPGDFLTLK